MQLTIEGEGAGPAKGPHLRPGHLLAAALPLLHPRLHMCCHTPCLPVSLCPLYAQRLQQCLSLALSDLTDGNLLLLSRIGTPALSRMTWE